MFTYIPLLGMELHGKFFFHLTSAESSNPGSWLLEPYGKAGPAPEALARFQYF